MCWGKRSTDIAAVYHSVRIENSSTPTQWRHGHALSTVAAATETQQSRDKINTNNNNDDAEKHNVAPCVCPLRMAANEKWKSINKIGRANKNMHETWILKWTLSPIHRVQHQAIWPIIIILCSEVEVGFSGMEEKIHTTRPRHPSRKANNIYTEDVTIASQAQPPLLLLLLS